MLRIAIFSLALATFPTAYGKGEKKDLFASIQTTQGTIRLKLYPNKTPHTVSNFVALARNGYFKGQSIGRIIPDQLVEIVDSAAPGKSPLGYVFSDEFHKDLRHDKPGVVSMLNAGVPNSNAGEFQITLKPMPHLNDRHTVFAEVHSGLEIVIKISQLPRNSRQIQRPKTPVTIENISIEGDWYQPHDIPKIIQYTRQQLKELTQDKAKKILHQNAPVFRLGDLLSFDLTSSQVLGNQFQVSFEAQFSQSRNVMVILYGLIENQRLKVSMFQFHRGYPPPE